ncbi:MAG: hypothetical protein H5T96_09195 [Tissierellales bacterium]|nr:hypothetical protein [Tissierellales bacterium]
MSELNWEKFEPLFGTWAPKFKKFFDQGGFDDIYKYLKKESQRGKVILPSSEDTFKCFIETPLDSMDVAIFGLSPYHSMAGRKIIADGLLMGCSHTGSLQPSLLKFYEGISNDMYQGLDYIKTPDVRYLANQGVLMCNASLTCAFRKAGSHLELWEPFMKYLFEEVINITGVPVIFLGREAAKLEKYILPLYGTHVFKLSHPASAAYNDEMWDSKGVFKQVNQIIKHRHETEIEWLSMVPF